MSEGSTASRTVPLLRWDADIFPDGDCVVIELADVHLRVDGFPPGKAAKLLSLFDGARAIDAAAVAANVPVTAAVALANKLVAESAAMEINGGEADYIAPQEFAANCRRLYRPLRERLASHPLWKGLNRGELPQSVFMGWLLENYHFIDGVNDRLALAAAACGHPKIRPLFIKHYTEEWDHSSYFMKALNIMGMSEPEVLAARPLPGTVAVLDHMRRAARTDPLEYAACSGFLESTGEDRVGAAMLFARLTRHYAGDKPQAMQSLADHMHMDGVYQHNSVVENICARIEPLSLDRASAALQAAMLLVETMEVWSSDILRSYTNRTLPPRVGFGRLRQ